MPCRCGWVQDALCNPWMRQLLLLCVLSCSPSGTRVGVLSAVDPDGDALVYTVVPPLAPCPLTLWANGTLVFNATLGAVNTEAVVRAQCVPAWPVLLLLLLLSLWYMAGACGPCKPPRLDCLSLLHLNPALCALPPRLCDALSTRPSLHALHYPPHSHTHTHSRIRTHALVQTKRQPTPMTPCAHTHAPTRPGDLRGHRPGV